jgi:hypothetical protein
VKLMKYLRGGVQDITGLEHLIYNLEYFSGIRVYIPNI